MIGSSFHPHSSKPQHCANGELNIRIQLHEKWDTVVLTVNWSSKHQPGHLMNIVLEC